MQRTGFTYLIPAPQDSDLSELIANTDVKYQVPFHQKVQLNIRLKNRFLKLGPY